MPDKVPEWLSKAIDSLSDTAQQILDNQEHLFDELEEIKGRLKKILKQVLYISAQLDEQVLVGTRSGLRHLSDGIKAETKDVRDDEFRLARAEFTKLINLNPDGFTRGTSGELPNKFLIGLGYWGSFHYFNLRGEIRNALVQVYELTEKDPVLGLFFFPPEYFSKDYAELIEVTEDQLSEALCNLQNKQGENFWQNLSYYSKQVLRGAATGIVGIGGFAIASTTGGWLTHAVGLLTAGTYGNLRPTEPQLHNISSLEEQVQVLGEQLQQFLVEVKNESTVRLQELQKIALKDLKNNRTRFNKQAKTTFWSRWKIAIVVVGVAAILIASVMHS